MTKRFSKSEKIHQTKRSSKRNDSKNSNSNSDKNKNTSKDSVKPGSNHITKFDAAELIFTVILLAAICALPTIHLFANNIGETTFADIGRPMWIFMGASIAVFAVLRIIIRKPYFASILVAVAAFLAVNFNLLVDFMRLFFIKYAGAAIGGIVLYVVILAGFFFLLRFLSKKKAPMHIITKILALTFAGLVIFNLVLAFIAMGAYKQKSENSPEVSVPKITSSPTEAVLEDDQVVSAAVDEPDDGEAVPEPTEQPHGLPNIYYFIVDEYGPFDIMSKYYDYDNKVFDDFLDEKGFNHSRETYSTDTQSEHAIADLLNLDYVSRKLDKEECFELIAKAQLHTILSDLGYSQFQLSTTTKYISSVVSLSSDAGVEAYDEISLFNDERAEGAVTDNSITGAFAELFGGGSGADTEVDTDNLTEWGFYPSEYIRETKEYERHDLKNYADSMLKIFEYFEDPANYTTTSPRVLYSYMSGTHVPFVFNEYGGIISYNDNRNWENTDVYLGQYKFVTKHLMATFSTIVENDPDSIIILMSDHGVRYHEDCKKKHTFYITDKDSCRIMNAVYIKGKQYDIEGLSGVNTLRFVLSLYDGLDFAPIEDPITSDSPDSLKGIIPKPR